jgi:hypothetical protein
MYGGINTGVTVFVDTGVFVEEAVDVYALVGVAVGVSVGSKVAIGAHDVKRKKHKTSNNNFLYI